MRLLGRRLVAPQLERRECTNHNVVSVRIPERELLCSSIRVRVRLLFEPGDERACPFQCHIEIVDAEEQEEPIARCRVVRARQRRMLVRAPLVEAEQDSSIRVEDLTKVGMARLCLRLAEERLVPFEATRHIAYADDRPGAFHDISPVGLTPTLSGGPLDLGLSELIQIARPLQRLVRLSRSSLILRGVWGQLYACIAWDLFKRNHL